MPFWGPLAAMTAANVIGGFMESGENERSMRTQRDIAYDNIMNQREFAQHGIRWRVEDAKDAGIHPLAALGAQTTSFSPISVGDTSNNAGSNFVRNMGQDISRAMQAGTTQEERLATNLSLENASLQNDLLRAQIATMQPSQIGPAIPSASNSGLSPMMLSGQGDSRRTGGYVVEKPLERIHSQPNIPSQEVGMIADYGFTRTPTGIAIIPSSDVKQRIEDQLIPELQWSLRNQMIPAASGLPEPDPRYYIPPKGFDTWKWSPLDQEFRPARKEPLSPYSREYLKGPKSYLKSIWGRR